jgi:hypothetical protein
LRRRRMRRRIGIYLEGFWFFIISFLVGGCLEAILFAIGFAHYLHLCMETCFEGVWIEEGQFLMIV